ncbi:MAG: Fe-S cluster assembly sulfur transfer protein SufU [Kofleriaceae bacterium]
MSDTDALYNAIILDHDRSPRNMGPLRGATHSATADNPMCGDTVTMHAIVEDGRVRDVTFEARGCALCRAAASLLTERIMSAPLDEIDAVIDTFEGFLTGSDADRRTVDLGDLRTFEAAKRVRARRTCMLLPFRAIAKALGVRSGL